MTTCEYVKLKINRKLIIRPRDLLVVSIVGLINAVIFCGFGMFLQASFAFLTSVILLLHVKKLRKQGKDSD